MRLPWSLKWRFAFAYTVLVFVSLGALSVYLVEFVRDTYISNLEKRLEHEAVLVSEAIAGHFAYGPDLASLGAVNDRLGSLVEARVTLIDRDGTVLADTQEDPAVMGDHSVHPEVRSALARGLGRSTRHSAIVGQEMLYTAAPIESGGATVAVARVALPTAQIHSNVNRIIATVALSTLAVALLSIGLAYLLAGRTSRSLRSLTEGAHRLAEGELDHRVEALSNDEAEEPAEAFNKMASTLRRLIMDLSGERDKLSAILETMADAVVVIDSKGSTVLLNRSAEALLDLGSKDALGRPIAETVRDHDLSQLVSQALESATIRHADVNLLQQRRFVSAIATPLNEVSGGGVLLTLHDLTEMRRLDTTRREFVSNVSHELRSPLASVKALTDTLRDGAVEEKQTAHEFFDRINKEVDRMTSLVNDLLELSRLESGRAPLNLSSVDLRHLIHEAVARTQREAEVGEIEVEVVAPDDLPLAIGEEGKLRQVLSNLLENALRATTDGGAISVSVRLKNRFVEVRVKDTGSGIPAEHVPHIFERFYKVDRARRDGGTGLGLAIVKHIVQAHGGDIDVLSEEGVGSIFTFTLPRAP